MAIIKAENLKKDYDGFLAVKGIDFSIHKGEVFGFLGPNGAGKTTTINMLTGLTRITSGQIDIAGIDAVKNIKNAQRMIGIVPDESNLYMEMDGFENLCFCAALYGIKKVEREKRAKKLLKEFNLDNTGNRLFKAYSKGMRRKLTIAAGIIHEPQILFLDEPTTGIDVESARQIRDLIVKLHNSGTTIFLTTHYIEEAERLCDRIAFIVNGEIVQEGTIEELMLSVQRDNIVQLSVDKGLYAIQKTLETDFFQYRFEIRDNQTFILYSETPITLMPIMKYFDERRFNVYEAKLIKPSLEDVFVKITGIEVSKMKKEKEGGKQ